MGTILFGLIVFAYWQRERIKKTWYSIRFPERMIKVNMIYPGNYIRHYWRLIPDSDSFELDGGLYLFDDKEILKSNNWYASKKATKEKSERLVLNIDGNEYFLDERLKIKNRWEKWPQIFYIFGNPFPVNWAGTADVKIKEMTAGADPKLEDKTILLSAQDLKHFKESTILTQLLASLKNNPLLIIILLVAFLALACSAAAAAKLFGLIK
jgi:hypothetical protein